jgi:hypothetical protein
MYFSAIEELFAKQAPKYDRYAALRFFLSEEAQSDMPHAYSAAVSI